MWKLVLKQWAIRVPSELPKKIVLLFCLFSYKAEINAISLEPVFVSHYLLYRLDENAFSIPAHLHTFSNFRDPTTLSVVLIILFDRKMHMEFVY